MATTHNRTDYHDINWGYLSLYRYEGILFVARTGNVERDLAISPLDVEDLPDFVRHLKMDLGKKGAYREISLWVIEKSNLRALGKALAKHYYSVRIVGHARILSQWLADKPEATHRDLDYFYDNITPEQREQYSY